MSNVSLTVKTVAGDGGTSYVDGNYLPAAELEADFNTIINGINGNLDETNLHASTQIPNTMLAEIQGDIVADYASDAAEYATATTPGDTGTPSLPTDLEEELARLRYRIGRNKGYASTGSTDTYYMTSAPAAAAAAWYEPAIVGHNLLPNPGFELHSAGTPNAPDGWTLKSTPATVALENPAHTGTGLEKRSLNIVANGNDEGIEVQIAGLKASTKYLVGMRYSLTAGTVNLTTTFGLSSGAYQNLALSDATAASSTVETLQGIVKSTAAPATMTVSIFGSASGADFNLHDVWMYEMSEGGPVDLPAIPTQTEAYTTADDSIAGTGAGAWFPLTDLSISQYIPYRGYRLKYETTLCFKSTTGSGSTINTEYAFRIQRNIDGGGATTVEGPYGWRTSYTGNNEFGGGLVTLSYVIDNPTPGSTYAFTVDAYVESSGDGANTLIMNPTIATGLATQSQSRLIVERI